jgi:hypothetical protein
LQVNIAAKNPLFSLGVKIAGNALRSDIVSFPPMHGVPAGNEMTSLEFGRVQRLATGEAVSVTVTVGRLPTYVFAEPFIDFLF